MKGALPRRIAIIGVSGNGKTTLACIVAARLGVPHVELDALCHLPNWQEASNEDFRRAVSARLAEPGWVVDGTYERKLGNMVYERAEVVVWLDLPLPLVLYRLLGRVARDWITQRNLYNGNRQTLGMAFSGRNSLVPYAIAQHGRRRRDYPRRLGALATTHRFTLIRLRSPREVARWLTSLTS